MFFAGLRFALGLIAGVSLFAGALALLLWAVELVGGWKKQKRRNLKAMDVAPRLVLLQKRDASVLQCSYCKDNWKDVPSQSEYLQ